MIDVGNVTTASLDAFGTGVTGSTCSGETASVTTTVANDIVFMATAESSSKTTTATGPSTLVWTNGVGGTITQPDASTGSISSSLTYSTSATTCAGLAFALKASAVPGAPTSLATGAITTTSIVLTWTHYKGPSVNVTLYQAVYSAGACGAYTGSSITAATGHTVTGLTSGTAYCWYVTQWNSTGQSAASNVVSDVQTANVPAAATGLTFAAISGSTTSLLALWTLPAQDTGIVNETAYITSGGSCAGAPTTTSLGTGQTAFTATGLTAATQYGVTIQLWNATGASAQTSCVAATTYATPGAPTGLGQTSTGQTTVALAWTQSAGTIVNDTVFVGLTCGTLNTQLSTGGAASAYTVTGLAPFTSYCFAVASWTGGTESAQSGTLTVQT